MKTKLILLTIIILCAVSTTAAQKMMKTDSAVNSLTEKEKMAWKSLLDKKYDDFDKMFAADYQGIYDFEVTDKAKETAEVRTMKFTKADVSNVKVSFPTADTAIVTAEVMMAGTDPGGHSIDGNYRTTSVYAKRGTQWLIVYHSHILIKQ